MLTSRLRDGVQVRLGLAVEIFARHRKFVRCVTACHFICDLGPHAVGYALIAHLTRPMCRAVPCHVPAFALCLDRESFHVNSRSFR